MSIEVSNQFNRSYLAERFCQQPQHFAWFLGAGASRAAGLPTATDIIWDLKRRHYCREENQEISRQDVQNEAVRIKIQSFFDARGFPPSSAGDEYSTYFAKIFGDDRERQRGGPGFLDRSRAKISVFFDNNNALFGGSSYPGINEL